MVWPNVVGPFLLAWVAFVRAAASARRLWARPLVVQQDCGWWLPEGLVVIACFAWALSRTALSLLSTSIQSGPLTVTSKEAVLLRGGMITLLGLGIVVLGSPPPLCSSVNCLMASNCSSGALSGI